MSSSIDSGRERSSGEGEKGGKVDAGHLMRQRALGQSGKRESWGSRDEGTSSGAELLLDALDAGGVLLGRVLVEEAGGAYLNPKGERYQPGSGEPIIVSASKNLALEIISLLS